MNIAIAAGALALGLLANLLGALKAASNSAGGPVHPIAWARKRPYRLACGLVGGVAGFVVLWSTGQLTPVAAFGCGYMGSDVIDKIASANANRFAQSGKE